MGKVLVTGAAGYVGNRVALELKSLGHSVRIFIKPKYKEYFKSSDFEVYTGDVLDFESVDKACRGMDTIVHFIALVDRECKDNPAKAFEITGLGTKNFLEAAAKNNVKNFIYISTYHVYDLSAGSVIKESTQLGPTNLDKIEYGASHIVAEMFCNAYKESRKMNAIILRVSNVYGAPINKDVDRWTLVPLSFCRQAFENKRITMTSDGAQTRDFVSIPDIVKSIQLVITKKLKQHIFNVGNGKSTSIMELAKAVASAYKRKFNKEIKIEHGSTKTNDPQFTYDISRLKELGYAPKDTMEDEFVRTFDVLSS